MHATWEDRGTAIALKLMISSGLFMSLVRIEALPLITLKLMISSGVFMSLGRIEVPHSKYPISSPAVFSCNVDGGSCIRIPTLCLGWHIIYVGVISITLIEATETTLNMASSVTDSNCFAQCYL